MPRPYFLLLLPFLAAPVLDGEITGPEKLSSSMCSSGQVLVKGASVWACGAQTSRTFLGSDQTEGTGAAYTTVFTIPLTMTTGKEQYVGVTLLQSTSLAATAIQNRARLSAANAVGTCHFLTHGGLILVYNAIQLGTSPADTGTNASLPAANEPIAQFIQCAISASNTTPTDLVVEFTAEDANTVTTHAGSFYEHIVN